MAPSPRIAHETLDSRLKLTGGRPSGFDYLRIVLAIAVILFHSMDVTKGYTVSYHDFHGVLRPFDAMILPMFFALSGFLVAGSLERSKTLISFLGLRLIRILPALAVETVLSAIVIGLIFSALPYRLYFTDPQFYSYALNIVGDVHFELPGVFLKNPHPDIVNGQLWTIPWEFKCYLTIAVLGIVGLAKRKRIFFFLTVILDAALLYHHVFFGTGRATHATADFHIFSPLLVVCFLYGISLYFFRERVILSIALFILSAVATICLLALPVAYYGDYLAPLPVAYMTIYLGLLEPRRIKLVSSGDYSYGIYLYGYPVQQAIVASFGLGGQAWYVNFSVSMAILMVIAYGSWHVIEKNASKLRPRLFNFESFAVKAAATIFAKPVAELE